MSAPGDENYDLRSAFEHIGGIVVPHSEIDAAFSEFLGMIFARRAELGLLETIFKTLDINRKVEIFRAFVKHPGNSELRTLGLAMCKKIEKVSSRRNIICHGLPWHNDGRSGLKLDSAAKYLHPDREKFVVYYDELLRDVLFARKVLGEVRVLCQAYK